MFVELKKDNLHDVVAEKDKVIVQYGATWCGKCRLMKPKFKKLAAENEEVTFVYVDAEKLPESTKLATVNTLPMFATFKDGQLIDQVQTNQAAYLNKLLYEITNN